jgi:hypothetical protein
MEIFGPSSETLRREFDDLQQSWVDDFFAEHMEFLTDRLFLVEDASVEARLLRTQIEDLSRLNQLYQNEFQRPLTREANRSISEKFQSILSLLQTWESLSGVREEIELLIDAELDRLADTINIFTDKTARDIIEMYVDIVSSRDHGWPVIGESYMSGAVERFFEYMTLEYINQVWTDISIIDGPLQCSEADMLNILRNVKLRLTPEELEQLNYNFRFSTTSWEYEFSFHDIFIPQDSYELWEIREYILNWIDLSNFIWHLWPREIEGFYNEWMLSHEQAWWFLEWEEGFQEDKNDAFSLSDALSTLWFSHTLLARINILFWRELNEQELENLNLMIRFFLFIESNGRNISTSGWYNVENYAWASSAEWYFQYLTQNGWWLRQTRDVRWWSNAPWNTSGSWWNWHAEVDTWNIRVRRFWWYNSYERALNSIPNEIVAGSQVFQWEREKIWNPDAQNPMSLSADDQIILFLSDLCNRRWGRECFEDIIWGDRNAIVRLYVEEHHTNVDEATMALVTLAGQRVLWFSESVVLFSPRPSLRPNTIPIPTPRPVE